MHDSHPVSQLNQLLLTPPEAAKALAVSEKTLWLQTAPRGPIPLVRLGKRGVRYSVAALEAWIAQQQSGGNS